MYVKDLKIGNGNTYCIRWFVIDREAIALNVSLSSREASAALLDTV